VAFYLRAVVCGFLGCLAPACSGSSKGVADAGPSGSGDAGTAESGTAESGTAESGTAESGTGAPTLLLLAAGGEGTTQATMGFSYDVTSDTWSAGTPLGDGTSGAIASPNGSVGFSFVDPGTALAVLTDATDTADPTGASGPVQFATWVSGTWTPFAAIGSGQGASGATSLAVGTASQEIAFPGEATKVESNAALGNGVWSAVVTLASSHGGPPSLALRGTDATMAYVRSSDGALVAVDRTSGTWGAETVIESGATATTAATSSFAPSLVALSGTGAELMVVYTDTAMNDLHFATRRGSQWSAIRDFGLPMKVDNTDPNRPDTGAGDMPSPSFPTPVLALPNGNAVLAFTSVNQYAYVSQFDGTDWSTATTVFASWGLDTIDSAQVGIAAGVGDATAEVVFGGSPQSSGMYVPYHTRLVAGQWTTPKPIVASLPGDFALYALASQ
jgi:hypothetical protein